MAILGFIAKNVLPIAGLIYAEKWALVKFADQLPAMYTTAGIPKLFGLVVLINGVTSGFVLLAIGFKPAAARKTLADKAKKDGDEHAEERFSFPKLYAEGFSENAHKFNCLQRGHQHALETYTMFVSLSLLGGLTRPVTTALGGLIWCVSRTKYAAGYGTGDPQARYTHSFWGRHVWTSLLIVAATATVTGVSLLTA